jgi:hypothetical protein
MSDKRDKDPLEQDLQSCVLVLVWPCNALDFAGHAGIVRNIF